ncbi:hypothetical protein MIMGU_mgv1a021096mg, partial [Erythranthe guttata]
DVGGRLITIYKGIPEGLRAERHPRVYAAASPRRIYIGNLPLSVDGLRLEEVFGEYGKVLSARVVCDWESGRSLGFGFVEMSTESQVNDAIAKLDGKSFDGRAIRVNVTEERPWLGNFRFG